MADAAKAAGVPTLVGLQAQSDPVVMYARDLVANGEIGEIVTVHLSVIVNSIPERGDGRIWQGIRKNGANPMTIPGGHSIDALCYIAGEFAEISARVTTRITMWKHAVTGEDFPVDAPDTVTAAGRAEERRGGVLPGGQRALQRERHAAGDIRPQGDAGADH